MPDPASSHETRALYAEILARAMRHAIRRVSRGQALDVAHDVACALVDRRLAGLDDPNDPRSYEALIYRAVANRLIDVKRTADRRAAAERVHHDERTATTPVWATSDGMVEQAELSGVVEAAIAAMPEVMRQVFFLVRHEELPYKTVAERLGIGVGTVHTHLARANVRLRKAIQLYRAETRPEPRAPQLPATGSRTL